MGSNPSGGTLERNSLATSNRVLYRSYMRSYMRRRWRRRRQIAIKYLGGKCVRCGSLKTLQFDHINRNTKSFTVAKMSSASEERFWAEIDKCQLLCHRCHNLKTIHELGLQEAKGKHGTVSSYKYCKCDQCKAAKAKQNIEYRKTHKRVTINGKRVWTLSVEGSTPDSYSGRQSSIL